MKRAFSSSEDDKIKRLKLEEHQHQQIQTQDGLLSFDENLLFEVLKHADAKTLGMVSCVSKLWQKAVQDERLWELVCTRQWAANIGCGNKQLRSVVLALGGFRRLHSQYLWPLSCSKQSARMIEQDAVHVSLSLLSIKYYEKMNLYKRGF